MAGWVHSVLYSHGSSPSDVAAEKRRWREKGCEVKVTREKPYKTGNVRIVVSHRKKARK